MSTGSGETLDKIQQEIKEALQREEELRKKHGEKPKENGYNNNNNNNHSATTTATKHQFPVLTNGTTSNSNNNKSNSNISMKKAANLALNSSRLFTPNPSSKGVMEKFLKMRGKLGMVTLKSPSSNTNNEFVGDSFAFTPAKIAVEPGKPIRNGFIPAEEKMRRELLDFQEREAALRKERRKSQPDLMAALEAEKNESNLKPARSMALMYSSEDLTEDSFSSGSLKPAKSLAELCDASDEELETPGTHSLIMQFEKLKNQARS